MKTVFFFKVSLKYFAHTIKFVDKMPPHGGHSCGGDSNHDDTPEMGLEYSLYAKIDLANLECLNEASDGSGKTVFKPWEDRLNFNTVRP